MDFELKNINSICRICMKTSKLKSIFKYKDRFDTKYEDLSEKLNSIGGTDIHIDDNLPHNICEFCADTLILAYDFKTLCKTTDAFLKNKIYNHNQELNVKVELNSFETVNKTFEDIKETKVFNIKNEPEESLDSNADIDRNYEDSSLDCDSEDVSDSQIEDDTDAFLQSEEDVSVHEKKQESVGKKYKCYACDRFLPTRWERQLHEDMECSLMPPGTLYKCRLCPATATDRGKFDNHIWRQHRGRSPPVESFPNVSKPVKEVKKSTREKTQSIICEQCGMLIDTMNNFKIHCLKHQGKYSLNCKECPFKTTNNYSYNCHMKYFHLGHDLIKCPHCTFTTSRNDYLKIHMRRHTGERPYPCRLCEYKAINHSNLKKHMVKHTNYKGFECKLCGRSYTLNKSLKIHSMRVHENQKMFYCKPCHTKYVGEEAFNRHLRSKHNSKAESPALVCDT